MSLASSHLMILPIVLPLLVGAGMLLLDERHRSIKVVINLGSSFILLGVAVALLRGVDAPLSPDMAIYRLGDWAMPFGIVLVVDRLSALMLVLTALLAVAALLFALARWHRAGPHFHPLFQFLLVGINGAFLTGDLFNLFVFFEVMLAASYGLVLHGSGIQRVTAGLHYIAINLAGSMLLLIGISLVYGATGTLNMADVAARVPGLDDDARLLMLGGTGVLAVAFMLKAGIWPLGFWLPTTYAAAVAPVAAIFAIMSKVGIYVIMRLWLLVFGEEAGSIAQYGRDLLLWAGLATIAFGSVGILAARNLARLAGFAVLISSGTLLAALGTGYGPVLGGLLFYLASSTLAVGAFFLLIELVQRAIDGEADAFSVAMEALDEEEELPDSEDEIGVAIPAGIAILGIAFAACALLITGLPPLSGFLAKFAMLDRLINVYEIGAEAGISTASWTLVGLLIFSGLASLIALTRAGIHALWMPSERPLPRVHLIEILPVGFLLAMCLGLTVYGGAVIDYMDATARYLLDAERYISGVLTEPAP